AGVAVPAILALQACVPAAFRRTMAAGLTISTLLRLRQLHLAYREASRRSTAPGPNPPTTRYPPSENSHSAIGIANSNASGDVRPTTPNSTAAVPASNSGAPIIPTTGSTRGTTRDQYSSGPSSSALKAGIVLPLNKNSRSYSPTSVFPATSP